MKILLASTPATGHLNPLLAIGRILIAEGHHVACLSGSAMRDRIEGIGADFHPLPKGADFDLRDPVSVVPELKTMPWGPELKRLVCERVFVDAIPAQHQGLQQVLRGFSADVIIADNTMFGVLPMLLGACPERPPIVLCGTSFLHWRREDGAPHFAGLPPATSPQQRQEYAVMARENDRIFNQPINQRLNQCLKNLGAGPVSTPLFDSVVELADVYMQLSAPGLEFPRDIPHSVHFVGALPIIPNQAPIPPWAHELDGSRKVVLVTQGTVANHDFSLLIGPALQALENERDLLVVVTAGGRPVSEVPGPIPANARIASYLPFEWVLPRTNVFVTNGGYGSVNQALSFGIPLVTAGLTEDKADVNARVAWSGVGINLETNKPEPRALREAVLAVLDDSDYRDRASLMAKDFAAIDTRSEILRIIRQVTPHNKDQRRGAAAAQPHIGRGQHNATQRVEAFQGPAAPLLADSPRKENRMLARKLALFAVACLGLANGQAALPSARAAAQSVNGGRLYIPDHGNAGHITEITGERLTVALRDGGLQAVEFEDIWRVRQAVAIDEPEGTIVIDYAGSRLSVEARLGDVIAAVRRKVPLTKFTAPNGQAIYLSAAKVTRVSNSLPALHNPLSKTVIGMSAGSQQVQESAAAARRILAEARAEQLRASLGGGA